MNRPVALIAVLLVGLGIGAGGVYAGDNAAVVEFDPRQPAVEPGETVALDVLVGTEGAHGDSGLYSVSLRLDYPAEYVTVVDAEAGSWFGQADRPVDVRERIRTDDEAGITVVEQTLRDPQDGVVGHARFATVTFAVEPDAPASTVVVAAGETTALLTSRYPQPVSARQAQLRVGGGGDRVEPEVEEDFEFATTAGGSGEATTDARSETAGTAEPSETAGGGTSEAAPTAAETTGDAGANGFLSGVAALVALLAALLWRR